MIFLRHINSVLYAFCFVSEIFFILIFSSGGLTYSQEENATSSSELRFLSVQHAG
jgi:hypothetical protein